MRSERHALSVLLLALVTILGLSAAVPEVSAWGLSVTPTTRTVLPGGQTDFTVSVTGTIPGNPIITLYCDYVSGGEASSYGKAFDPSSQGIAPFISTLWIIITPWASPKELHLRVTAEPDGPEGPQTRDITVIVPAPWDLGVSPSSRDVGPGGSTTFTVYVTGAIAGNPNVHLYGSAPIAVTFSFSTNDQPAPFTSTMTITVNPAAPTGSRIITVDADPAGAEAPKSRQVTLNVITLTIPWSVSVSPTSKSVQQGATTSFTVSVTGTIPGNPNVHLMIGSPVIVGMTFSFSVDDRPAPFASTMTVVAGSGVGPGDYLRTLIAHPASGPSDKTVDFHVVVVGAPSGWDLSINPASQSVAPGGSTQFTASVTGLSPSTNIQLLYSPPVQGISVTFSVNNRPAPFDSIMTVSVDSSKSVGIYPIQIWGHPAGAGFPGPDNKERTVSVIVVAAFPATTTVGPTTSAAAWDLSITPDSCNVAAGGSTTFTVQITGTSGATNIELVYSPAVPGISATFSVNKQLAPFESIMTVAVDASKPADAYAIQIWGHPAGSLFPGPDNKARAVKVVVGAPAPTTTTATTTSSSYTETSTTTTGVAQTTAQTETVTKTLGGEILQTIQQNSLPIIAALAVLIILFAALAFRRRRTKNSNR